jgi:hypothetical protein
MTMIPAMMVTVLLEDVTEELEEGT